MGFLIALAIVLVPLSLGMLVIVAVISDLENQYNGLPPGMATERAVFGVVALAFLVAAAVIFWAATQEAALAQEPTNV